MTNKIMRNLKHSLRNILNSWPKILCKGSNCWVSNLGEIQHPRVVIVHRMMRGRPMGNIFLNTIPHNQPHDFKNHNGIAIPKFLKYKEGPYTTYDAREVANDWKELSDECRKVIPFDQFIRTSL